MRTGTIGSEDFRDASIRLLKGRTGLAWLDAAVLGAFLVVFAGTLLGGRDFSHLHINLGTNPLYVTDAFLLAWTLVRARIAWALIRSIPLEIVIPLSAFGLIGFLHLAGGVVIANRRLDVLRDFMIVGYATFLFVGLDIARSASWVTRLYQLTVLAAPPIVAAGLLNLATGRSLEVTTSFTERALPIADGLYLIMAAFVCAVAIRLNWRPRWAYVAILVVSLLGLLLVQSRSIVLALLPVAAIYLGAYRLSTRQTITLTAGSLCVAVLVVLLAMHNALPAYLAARLESFANLSADPNASWRLKSWQIAVDFARQQPIAGMGFGELHLLPYGIAPHNSLVSILYQMGIPGEVAFLAFNVGFYFYWYRSYRGMHDSTLKGLLLIALAWQVAVLVIALFNVALEGPFMSMFYWLSMGFAFGLSARPGFRTTSAPRARASSLTNG